MIYKLQTARPIPGKDDDVMPCWNWILGSCTTCVAPFISSHPLAATASSLASCLFEIQLVAEVYKASQS